MTDDAIQKQLEERIDKSLEHHGAIEERDYWDDVARENAALRRLCKRLAGTVNIFSQDMNHGRVACWAEWEALAMLESAARGEPVQESAEERG